MEAIIDPQIDLDPTPVPPFRPPTILDEIASAVQAYPVTDVELELHNLDTDRSEVNVGEQVSFNVRVTNRGPLTMKNVRLKAVARNGAEVRSDPSDAFAEDAVSDVIDTLDSGNSSEFRVSFTVEVPNKPKPAGTVLVEVTVDSWDAEWTHVLDSRSGASATPTLTFASRVLND